MVRQHNNLKARLARLAFLVYNKIWFEEKHEY